MAGRSVNFILPQLRARQGERTSLAPRPHRPTFLFYGPPWEKETETRAMPLCTTRRVHDEFRPNRERRNGREKERIHGSARTGQREGTVRVCVCVCVLEGGH